MEMPLDDYRFEPDFQEKKVRRDFLSLLPEEEELLWTGKMQRGLSYWWSKGVLAAVASVVCLVITSFLWRQAYVGYFEGEYAGKYARVLIAFGASLLPWLASYLLLFSRLIYDARTRYGITANYLLVYNPARRKQPYKGYALTQLAHLKQKTHSDATVSITHSIEVPDEGSGETQLIDLPLLEFIEKGKAIYEQLSDLQAEAWKAEEAAQTAEQQAQFRATDTTEDLGDVGAR